MSDQPTKTVPVRLGERSYDIDIGATVLGQLPQRLQARLPGAKQPGHYLVVADSNVLHLAQTVVNTLADAGHRVDLLPVPPGERSKSVQTAEFLWEQMLSVQTDRQSSLVAVGGGVIGDLAGFVAATYARGLPFVQVPTTLLAQVDSSVGGKVGINLPQAKNMVGAFWQPRYVLIDIDALHTLPEREYLSGLAEVVKYGVIQDADFFAYLEQQADALRTRRPDVLQTIIARCCELKADVVAADERELSGRRAILNYGHTFAHALESITGYGRYLHGEAVAVGMGCAARLAGRLGRVDEQFETRQRQLLAALQLPTDMPDLDIDRFIELMQHDKKVAQGELRFVLPSQLGHVELVADVPTEDIRAAIEESQAMRKTGL